MFFLWVQIVVMFFLVFGTIGKSHVFFWFWICFIFFMAWDIFLMDLDIFLNDFIMGLEMVLAKIVKTS